MTKAQSAAARSTNLSLGLDSDVAVEGNESATQIQRALMQHQGSLVRYAQHFVGDLDRARDVVQDTFLKLCSQPATDSIFDDERHLTKWLYRVCLLYTSPSPRDGLLSRMPSSA